MCAWTHMHTYMYICMHIYLYATHTNPQTHTSAHTHTHTHTHKCINWYIGPYIHSFIHACVNKYIHTFTCTKISRPTHLLYLVLLMHLYLMYDFAYLSFLPSPALPPPLPLFTRALFLSCLVSFCLSGCPFCVSLFIALSVNDAAGRQTGNATFVCEKVLSHCSFFRTHRQRNMYVWISEWAVENPTEIDMRLTSKPENADWNWHWLRLSRVRFHGLGVLFTTSEETAWREGCGWQQGRGMRESATHARVTEKQSACARARAGVWVWVRACIVRVLKTRSPRSKTVAGGTGHVDLCVRLCVSASVSMSARLSESVSVVFVLAWSCNVICFRTSIWCYNVICWLLLYTQLTEVHTHTHTRTNTNTNTHKHTYAHTTHLTHGQSDTYVLNNHLRFKIKYHPVDTDGELLSCFPAVSQLIKLPRRKPPIINNVGS